MEQKMEIPEVVFIAIEKMKKCFGGTEVNLISEHMYRLEPNEYYKAGQIVVDIEIEGIKAILPYNDIALEIVCSPFGEMIANQFVYDVINR